MANSRRSTDRLAAALSRKNPQGVRKEAGQALERARVALDAGAVDIVKQDLCWTGGFTEFMRIATEADGAPYKEVAEELLDAVANAGSDFSAGEQTTVNLDGTGSSDPDGGNITYEWSVISRPAGSTAQINPSETAENPEFWVDVAGVLILPSTG